jgi:hypothetical protein
VNFVGTIFNDYKSFRNFLMSKLTAPATFANVLHGTARIGALDLYPPLLDSNIPNSVKCMYSGKIAVPPRRVVEG